MPKDPKKKPFDPEIFMKGISAVESAGGQFMFNPTSTATGLYGQLYSTIDPTWMEANKVTSRDQFGKDTALQNNYMRQSIYGDMSKTDRRTNLFKDAVDLEAEYKPQLGDRYDYRADEIAALSHFLGRGGARQYLGSTRDNKPYNVGGINKAPEEYLELYNEAIGDQTLPGRDSFKLQDGGTIMAKKKYQGGGKVGIKNGQLQETYDPGTPLNQVVNFPSDFTESQKIAATQSTKDQLNRFRWANFHGNMVDYPSGTGGVQSFQYTPNMLQEMENRGLTKDYIESYQPTNYQNTLSPEETAQKWQVGPQQLPQYGLGDFINKNPQSAVGGLKTALGIGAMFVPGMQATGMSMIGGGIGQMLGGNNQVNAEDLRLESEQELLDAQELDAYKANKNQQLQGIANKNSNYKLEYGGPIPYSGQSHSGPQQGIPVDSQGNPVAVTKQKPVALTEGGEVAWRTEDGTPYVFSAKSGAAAKANKIFKNAKMRLGEDYNNPDPISKEGMQRNLTNLMASEEANKPKEKQTRQLANGGFPEDPPTGRFGREGISDETISQNINREDLSPEEAYLIDQGTLLGRNDVPRKVAYNQAMARSFVENNPNYTPKQWKDFAKKNNLDPSFNVAGNPIGGGIQKNNPERIADPRGGHPFLTTNMGINSLVNRSRKEEDRRFRKAGVDAVSYEYGGDLPQAGNGMGIFNWKRPRLRKKYGQSFEGFGGAGAGVQPPVGGGTDTGGGGGDQAWSPFATQALISGASAGLGALGNVLLAKNREAPEPIIASKVSAPQVSFAEQRIQADVDAAEARGRSRSNIRRGGLSKAEDQAAQGVIDAKITGQTGRVKSESAMRERTQNVQGVFQAQAQNQQAVNRARQLNAIRTDQFNQGQTGLYGQAISNVTGGIRDIGSAYQDSQYLSTLSGRSGYEMRRDPADGKVKLMPIPGYWENKV